MTEFLKARVDRFYNDNKFVHMRIHLNLPRQSKYIFFCITSKTENFRIFSSQILVTYCLLGLKLQDLMWFHLDPLLLYALSHQWHLCLKTPLWISWCSVNFSFLAKDLPHVAQTCGLSLEWILLTWPLKCCAVKYDFPQCWHTWVLVIGFLALSRPEQT